MDCRLLYVSFALEYTRCWRLKASLCTSIMLRWTLSNSSTRGSRSQTDPQFFFAAAVQLTSSSCLIFIQLFRRSFTAHLSHYRFIGSHSLFPESSAIFPKFLLHCVFFWLHWSTPPPSLSGGTATFGLYPCRMQDSSTYRHVAQSQTEL